MTCCSVPIQQMLNEASGTDGLTLNGGRLAWLKSLLNALYNTYVIQPITKHSTAAFSIVQSMDIKLF